MKRIFLVFWLFFFISIGSLEGFEDKEALFVKRIYAHLQIKDYASGCDEARQGLERFSKSQPIWQAYLKVLAKAGDEKNLLVNWNRYVSLFPEERENHALLEAIAWCIIEKGSKAQTPSIRAMATLAAFFSQDAKGVDIVDQSLRDPSAIVRSIAVKLASEMQDDKLRDQVLDLFKTEKSWNVRLEAIQAVGKMKINAAKPHLLALIADEKSAAEEKVAAIQALVTLLETVHHNEVKKLAHSDRAGLRLLACEVVASFDLMDDLEVIVPLVHDSHAEVRAAALQTIGILRKSPHTISAVKLATSKLQDPDSTVAITAAWVLTLWEPQQGQRALEPWLSHELRDTRLLAAAALANSGNYGFPLTLRAFRQNTDLYVRMNLAMGMIGQRIHPQEACDGLYRGLTQAKERWTWEEKGIFRYLAPSKVKHDEATPQYPEAVNQLTRLEILNVLAIMKYGKAQEAIKKFLQERNWGVTGLAAALLLTEGDEMAVDLVRNLLKDSNQKVRIQAALILSLWGGGEEALSTLEEAYPTVDRELKEHILEGILQVGAPESIPFLIDRLQEPSQSIRIIIAAAFLQCLYH
jgi:HEAT repeat protein